MTYKIIVSPRAQKEIENAIEYYALYSSNAPRTFINLLNEAYLSLSKNPFFSVHYKNVRALKINKFPYSLYFVINETQNLVRILGCFHNKRNPDKRPNN
ncbi:MAG: plasmid stabilization protein [Bacteroidetes bacterium HGW-Bacteroidetes-23]|nr:MAG: plasmid stabilization protein [Bacteroidetes bacterium HGW-Bacteroidetes-23]